MELDPANKESFEIVEKALFCIALDEVSPSSYDEVCFVVPCFRYTPSSRITGLIRQITTDCTQQPSWRWKKSLLRQAIHVDHPRERKSRYQWTTRVG